MMKPELIVMLTNHDRTVSEAQDVFEICKNSKAKYFGFKEEGLSLDQMKKLFQYMKENGKTTFLEIVAYSEKECLEGIKMALECRVDYVMGTKYYESVNRICQEHHLTYLPFLGEVHGRPSILEGTAKEMIKEAKYLESKGVKGFDLLGYRYVGNKKELNEEVIKNVSSKICLAGSIDSYSRLDEVIQANPWTFTIGSAFFNHQFGDTMKEQIDSVCMYVRKK